MNSAQCNIFRYCLWFTMASVVRIVDQMQVIIFFWNVNILFTSWCRTSLQETWIFSCGDIKNIVTNNSIKSIHIKPSQSAFITKWEPYSVSFVLTCFSETFHHQLFNNASCSKPMLITVCNIVATDSLWVCVICFSFFYYFCFLNTNILITLYSHILTVSTSLMKTHKRNVHFDNEHNFIWRNLVRMDDC